MHHRGLSAAAAMALALGLGLSALIVLRYQDSSCRDTQRPERFRPISDAHVVARTTDVFVGRVLEQNQSETAPEAAHGDPALLGGGTYVVKVLQTVTGEATGIVSVVEPPLIRLRCQVLEEDRFLQQGEEALFVTMWEPGETSYLLTRGARSRFRIRNERDRTALIERFHSALATPRQATPLGTPLLLR